MIRAKQVRIDELKEDYEYISNKVIILDRLLASFNTIDIATFSVTRYNIIKLRVKLYNSLLKSITDEIKYLGG
jgi:hypothetical protein